MVQMEFAWFVFGFVVGGTLSMLGMAIFASTRFAEHEDDIVFRQLAATKRELTGLPEEAV
jgi:hypothetical protein